MAGAVRARPPRRDTAPAAFCGDTIRSQVVTVLHQHECVGRFATGTGFGENEKGRKHAQTDQAFIAELARGRGGRLIGTALSRQRGGDTATVWWTQGFAQEEDIAFKKLVADYEKASSNTIDYTIVPYAPLRQKIISAVTSGTVPDLYQNTPFELIALQAWADKLVDVSDVVETQKEEYTQPALLSTYCYNGVEKKRSFYGVPYTSDVFTNHIWRPLVEKAGYKIEDIPKTWDAFYDFFKGVQKSCANKAIATSTAWVFK